MHCEFRHRKVVPGKQTVFECMNKVPEGHQKSFAKGGDCLIVSSLLCYADTPKEFLEVFGKQLPLRTSKWRKLSLNTKISSAYGPLQQHWFWGGWSRIQQLQSFFYHHLFAHTDPEMGKASVMLPCKCRTNSAIKTRIHKVASVHRSGIAISNKLLQVKICSLEVWLYKIIRGVVPLTTYGRNNS